MDKRKITKHKGWLESFLIGSFIGAITFVCVYGFRILDVTYDDWLFKFEQDPAQHYLGWQLFRNSNWHFPIGLCDQSIYPNYISVIYTDSIPIVCLFFKLFSNMLPKTFQFIGLYGLFCYMMQGGVSKLILRKFIDNEIISTLGVVPFVLSISFVQRMFLHTALASHYLILVGILLFVYRNNMSIKKRVLFWTILGCITASIHIYLFGMISIMLLGEALLDSIDNDYKILRKISIFICYTSIYLISTLFILFLLGAFYGENSISDIQLGIGSANLNSMFNPFEYSIFFKALPSFEDQTD